MRDPLVGGQLWVGDSHPGVCEAIILEAGMELTSALSKVVVVASSSKPCGCAGCHVGTWGFLTGAR